MRTGIYVSEIDNVQRFTSGVTALENRGAAEAGWLLIEGDSGLGKTRALQWYSVQQNAPIVRAKSGWHIPWMLKDICEALDLSPAHSSARRFDQIVADIVDRQKHGQSFTLIVDEIEHVAKSLAVLEALRDITDITQCTLIIAGMKDVRLRLKKHDQVYNRIADVVRFERAQKHDVRVLCDKLAEVEIADDVVERILKDTGGIFRRVMNAIARVERAGKRNAGQVITAEHISHISLLNDDVRGRAA